MPIPTEASPRPCHLVGSSPNDCAAAHYRRVIDNHVTLYGPWQGWRMAGRELVSPDGDRISPERLRGLLFKQAAEARIDKARQGASQRTARARIIPPRELFLGRA